RCTRRVPALLIGRCCRRIRRHRLWRQLRRQLAVFCGAFCYNHHADFYYSIETAIWPLVRIGESVAQRLGALLVCLVILLTASVVFVFYTCLLPAVYFESRLRCLWHLLFGHWLLVNIVFHYYCAAFSDPGSPPAGCTFPVVGVCRRCVAPKPPRAHHCAVCKRCVLRMDHHCPWINSCVGLYNYKHFVLFCVYMLAGCVYVALVAAPVYNDHFYSWDRDDDYATVHHMVYYEIVLTSAVALVLGCLTAYHVFLASRNETCIETHINRRMAKSMLAKGLTYRNPYDLGWRKNLRQALCIDAPGRSFWRHVLLPSTCPASQRWTVLSDYAD
uniref:Palmitoyltransferase n=1 Tax=Macrostomum lignano TaxID=282301 RepID=A0A1I8F879_9PLAT